MMQPPKRTIRAEVQVFHADECREDPAGRWSRISLDLNDVRHVREWIDAELYDFEDKVPRSDACLAETTTDQLRIRLPFDVLADAFEAWKEYGHRAGIFKN